MSWWGPQLNGRHATRRRAANWRGPWKRKARLDLASCHAPTGPQRKSVPMSGWPSPSGRCSLFSCMQPLFCSPPATPATSATPSTLAPTATLRPRTRPASRSRRALVGSLTLSSHSHHAPQAHPRGPPVPQGETALAAGHHKRPRTPQWQRERHSRQQSQGGHVVERRQRLDAQRS